jgi:hypothetical protein
MYSTPDISKISSFVSSESSFTTDSRFGAVVVSSLPVISRVTSSKSLSTLIVIKPLLSKNITYTKYHILYDKPMTNKKTNKNEIEIIHLHFCFGLYTNAA